MAGAGHLYGQESQQPEVGQRPARGPQWPHLQGQRGRQVWTELPSPWVATTLGKHRAPPRGQEGLAGQGVG